MDQIALFSAVRPEAPADDDVAAMCGRARDRITAEYRKTPRRRRRTIALALPGAGLAAAAAAALVAVAVLPGGHARPGAPAVSHSPSFVPAAYTVQRNPSGTVTVTIRQMLGNPAGLQHALARAGVPALVRYIPYKTASRVEHGVTGSVSYPACEYQGGLPVEPQSVAEKVLLQPPSHTGPSNTPMPWVFAIRPGAMPKGSVVYIETGFAWTAKLLTSSRLPRCVPAGPPPGW
jgi:hypothetical protein